MFASNDNEELIKEVKEDIFEFGENMRVYAIFSYFPGVDRDFVTDYVHAEKPERDEYMTDDEYSHLIEQFNKQLSTLDKTKHKETTLAGLLAMLQTQANAFNQTPKTPKSTRKAIKKYQETHKADNYRNQTKSKAKKFIRDFARRDELLELRKMIDEKLKNE